ncbi:MAG: hypothetical protein K0U93_06525 [Gammaproteobacteria bacterium]|nr:hypothetical protein [Gammaproteobacteria bacterium]
MISSFLDIVDRLAKLIQIQADRRDERFDSVLEPTFDELSILHGDYVSMFETAKKAIAADRPLWDRNGRKTVAKAKAQLVEHRIAYEPLRVKVASLMTALDENKTLSQTENAYVNAVLAYFVAGCPTGPFSTAASGLLDNFDDFLRDLEFWDRGRYDEMRRQASDGGEAIAMLTSKIDDIQKLQRTQWREVCDKYAWLKAKRYHIALGDSPVRDS